jgi:hypothetical protein
MLLQLGDGRWRTRLTDVPRWGQTQRILIHQADGQATTENQQQDYDARARPWYLAARALGSDADVAWTAPYTFFTTGDPGVTAAVRLPATGHLPAGALGVDLKLRDLSQVTMSASLGARGMALVLTEDERVLALPRAPAGTDAKNWANLVLRDTPALGLPAVDAAVALWRQGGHQPLQVQDVGVSGTRWLVSAIPYALGSQRLWVFTLAPAADFSPAWGRLFLLLGAAVLVLLIPVVWLARDQARRIVEPLEALARQSERIGQLDFSQPPAEVNTPVRELRQLSDAQEHMRQLLQTHQHELDDHIRALELAQGEIHQLAFFDPLTRLPNRRLFMDRLGLALARCGPCCSLIWTTSRRSTTPWAMPQETLCCSWWPRDWCNVCVRPTACRALAVTNFWSCLKTWLPDRSMPWRWLAGKRGKWPRRCSPSWGNPRSCWAANL